MAVSTPFRFFDLPRELRNTIYSQLTCDMPPRLCHSPSLGISNCVVPGYRLISRRFLLEYEEEVTRSSTLIVAARFATLRRIPLLLMALLITYPGLLSPVRTVTLRVDASLERLHVQQDHVDDIATAAEAVMASHSLPTLCSLRVELTLKCCGLHEASVESTLGPRFLRAALPERYGVLVKRTLLLRHGLFMMNANLKAPANMHRDHYLDLIEYMEHSRENEIMYEAKLASRGNGIFGLDLTTHTAGTYDYHALSAAAEEDLSFSDLGMPTNGCLRRAERTRRPKFLAIWEKVRSGLRKVKTGLGL